jgi:hypothetical protein
LPTEENAAVSISIYDAVRRLDKSMSMPASKAGSKYSFQPQLSIEGYAQNLGIRNISTIKPEHT